MSIKKKGAAQLLYKGKPITRKGKFVYYGNLVDQFIVCMIIEKDKKVSELDVATRVSVQLLRNTPSGPMHDKAVKKVEREGLFGAMDIAAVWLEDALSK